MLPHEMTAIRKRMGYSQMELATLLGMSMRGYRKLENEEAPIKPIHSMAVLYASMMVAVMEKDASLAADSARNITMKLATLIENSAPEP